MKGEKDRGEKRHLRGTNPTVSKKRKVMLTTRNRTFSYLPNIGMSDKERVENKNASNNEKKFLWRLVRSVTEQLRDDLGQT